MENNNKRISVALFIITAIIFVAIGAAIALWFFGPPARSGDQQSGMEKLSSEVPVVVADNKANAAPADHTDAIDAILPSVVGVSVYQINKDNIFDQETTTMSVGSGVIVSESGYIVTNHHVLGTAKSGIQVSFSDGRVVTGDVVWSDSALDLAIVRVAETGLVSAALGDAKLCRVGQEAYAIGNPLGLQFQRTVTKGVISAMYRTISTEGDNGETVLMEDLLQTDASINPGNSGGPLINASGEVVGINTVKLSTAEGIGFAVPINVVKPIVQSLENTGEFKAPYFGIFAYDRPVADYLTQNFSNKTGIYVVKVDTNSPAYNIGIRADDIITHINKKEINTMMDFRTEIYGWNSDTPINITFISGGALKEASVTLKKNR